jgi:CRP-like cAMP-binding protein
VPAIATRNETFGSEGLQSNARYMTDARAEEETETLFMSGTRFRAYVREQPLHAIALFSQLMAERATLLDKLRELTTLSVEQRMVATFGRFAHTDIFSRADGRISLCPQRYRLLCELVGATRESVSLVLGRLTAEGLAEKDGSTILLHSLPALQERVGALDLEVPIPNGEAQAETAIH